MATWKNTDNNEVTRGTKDENQQKLNLSQSNQLNTVSMTQLILWNINKAFEKNPTLELKAAMKMAQDNLDSMQLNVSAIVSQRPDERHISCALLAWQQLGHSHVDSLYSFVVAQMKVEPKPQVNSTRPGQAKKVTCNVPYEKSFITHKESDYVYSPTSSSMSPPAMGPVLRLPVSPPAPVAPRVAIPVYNVQGGATCGGLRKTGQDIKKRIETACCLESACLEKLTAVDKGTKELRQRLSKLARRETERIELLERAETAWRDLEMGYMRRLRKCVEKEEDIARKSAKMITDRNTNKEICAKLVEVLKPRGETAEQARDTLQMIERDVCNRACERLKQSELAAKEDSILIEIQCQSNRQDRDFQFKEEAIRRKKATLDNELESVRGLAYETERTMKAELQGFKEQLQAVADELIAEDETIVKVKGERDELVQEKKDLTDDLEGCQKKCDLYMKKRLDQLKEKREKLLKLKDQTMECKCKFPMETAVQVKRTPSLAALCYCSPEDRVKKTCSCMSMRSRLLSDLFVSLFDGLQFEMADSSIKMPCELLKCLEDSHNWDKASTVKSNLRSYFAKMLCGELDIAIVNSIENYHARYVGTSCADMGRPIPDYDDPDIEGWQDRALAQKAHWMAEAMAEQMFQERVDDIMEQAQKVVSDGPPPCKCKPPPNLNKNKTAVYQLFVDPVRPLDCQQQEYYTSPVQPIPLTMTSNNCPKETNAISVTTNRQKKKAKEAKNTVKMIKEAPCSTVARTFKNDVLLLKAEIEDLKKDSIKKHDLKMIEQTIKKLVRQASGPDNRLETPSKEKGSATETSIKDSKNTKLNSLNGKSIKKKKMESKFKRQYSVNMCFCGLHKNSSSKSGKHKSDEIVMDSNAVLEQKKSEGLLSQNISLKQSKPILKLHSEEYKETAQRSSLDIQSAKVNNSCGNKCGCFNKIPSSSSIDRLLDTLMKWNSDLNEPRELRDQVESDINLKETSHNPASNIKDMSAIMCHSIVINDGCKEVRELNKPDQIIINQDNLRNNFGLLAAESKYMGTINLEKSYENVSKCVKPMDKSRDIILNKQSKESKKSRKSTHSKSLCKCISKLVESKSVESKNKRKVKSEEYKKNNDIFINQRKIKSLEVCKPSKPVHSNNIHNNDSLSFSNRLYFNKLSSSLNNETQGKSLLDIRKPVPLLLIDNKYDEKLKEHVSVRSNYNLQEPFDHNLIDLDNLPCGCEYQIKLIGVTLDNTDKNTYNRFAESINQVSSFYPKQTKCQKQETKAKESSEDCIISNFYPQKSMEHYDLFKNSKTNAELTELGKPLCQCKSKFDELKGLLLNIYKDKGETKDDKSLDTNSLKVDSKLNSVHLKNDLKFDSSKDGLKDENCVCCIDLANESNELEVNTFHLLQEHIKKKLENLKDTCQSSYCINPDEEDQVLKRLFIKIRKTITDGTGKITCKCSEEADQKGSWQRAYNLLQEYLKIKIGRVECSCAPGQNNKDTILPELTDKVCFLIEKDFERLRDICKCRSKRKSTKSSFDEEANFQVPEKDNNNQTDKNENSILKKSSFFKDLSSKSYIISTHNTSAQVIPNFESKSCEAIKFSDPVKSTVETQSSNECQKLKKACSVDCNVLDAAKIVNSQSTQYSRNNENELESNLSLEQCLQESEHILTKFKELAIELKGKENKSEDQCLPYIGLTIDCTCSENVEQCGCSKAKIVDNNKAIAEFWATYTKSQATGKNISYLMKNTHKNALDSPDNMTNIPHVNKTAKPCAITDKKVNTKRVGGLTLKDSREYVNKQSCHGGTNTEDDEIINSSEIDDTSEEDWYEMNPEVDAGNDTFKPPIKKYVHFLHRSKSEVVATDGSKASVVNNPDCDCSKVPVCHVKMLVENIECKLANSECTCDSLSSKVCPVHSKRDS